MQWPMHDEQRDACLRLAAELQLFIAVGEGRSYPHPPSLPAWPLSSLTLSALPQEASPPVHTTRPDADPDGGALARLRSGLRSSSGSAHSRRTWQPKWGGGGLKQHTVIPSQKRKRLAALALQLTVHVTLTVGLLHVGCGLSPVTHLAHAHETCLQQSQHSTRTWYKL